MTIAIISFLVMASGGLLTGYAYEKSQAGKFVLGLALVATGFSLYVSLGM